MVSREILFLLRNVALIISAVNSSGTPVAPVYCPCVLPQAQLIQLEAELRQVFCCVSFLHLLEVAFVTGLCLQIAACSSNNVHSY